MSNRNYAPEKGNLQRGMVSINGEWTVGAAGAVTPIDGVGKSGMTLTRTSVGAYTITTDPFTRYKLPSVQVIAPSGTASDGLAAYVLVANVATRTITFQLRANNFSAADAPSGATICIEIRCKDSSV